MGTPSTDNDAALPAAWREPSWESAAAEKERRANRFDLSTRRDQVTLFLLLSPAWGALLAKLWHVVDPADGPTLALCVILVSQVVGGALLLLRKLPGWVRLIVLFFWIPVTALVVFFGGWLVLGMMGAKP